MTSARAAGLSWSSFRRTVALRVVGSMRASMATILAPEGDESLMVKTSTLPPTRRLAATGCATVKSTCAASSTPCKVVIWVPSFRYWPG